MTAPFPLQVLDEGAVRRWVFRSRTALSANRDRLNQLNVFPVPDGDTGTNMYLTLHASLESLMGIYLAGGSSRIREGTQAMARSTLLSARGNSGVILSQLVRGIADVVTEGVGTAKVDGIDGIDGPMLARALRAANDRAWQGVSNPVEGTILTVSKAAADSAEAAAARDPALASVSGAALDGARTALAATPALLPSLAEAGVVDAGGAGLVLILTSLHEIVTGQLGEAVLGLVPPGRRANAETPSGPAGVAGAAAAVPGQPAAERRTAPGAGDQSPDESTEPGYEVMYLIDGCSDPDAERLRGDLLELGDSVLVVGSPELRTVHVHTDEAGHAIEAGMACGKVYGIRVTWLLEAATVRAPTEHTLQCPMGPIPPEVAAKAPAQGSGTAAVLSDAGEGQSLAPGAMGVALPAAIDVSRGLGTRPTTRPAAQAGDDPAAASARATSTSGPGGATIASAVRSAAAPGAEGRTVAPAEDPGRLTGGEGTPRQDGVGLVCCANGPGMIEEFTQAGARVVNCGPGSRATPEDIFRAVMDTGFRSVVVLPNDSDAIMPSEAAADLAQEEGVETRVLPTEWAVQGIAAVAVFDPDDPLATTLERMADAAAGVRAGMVAIAGRNAWTDAGPCSPGDALGFVGRGAVTVGSDLPDIAVQVAERLLQPSAELLTLVAGADGKALADRVAGRMAKARPDLEIVRIDGGQPLYPLLLGAE